MSENCNQSKQVFRQDIQTSARYVQSLKIAEKACKQFNALSIGDRLNRFNHELDLNEDELLIVGHDYIVSSMENFINHLGFILHCSWENFERKNFWDQYKELVQLLELANIDTSGLNIFDGHDNVIDVADFNLHGLVISGANYSYCDRCYFLI